MTPGIKNDEFSAANGSRAVKGASSPNVVIGIRRGGFAQSGGRHAAIANKLGYAADAKLLIIHGDDMGLSHSVNQATNAALRQGALSAASIMVPCPWFWEVAQYAHENPQADLGIHLTFTSEWRFYRWGPIAAPHNVPSLLCPDGYFWPDVALLAANAKATEIELEMRAQLDRALSAGITPSHVDCHMFAVFSRPDLFSSFVNVARDYSLPFLAFRSESALPLSSFHSAVDFMPQDVLLDDLVRATERVPRGRWKLCHLQALNSLMPGVYQLIVHLGFDDSEMQSITSGRWGWGSEWRQLDYDLVTSSDFRDFLIKTNIHVVGWKELRIAAATLP